MPLDNKLIRYNDISAQTEICLYDADSKLVDSSHNGEFGDYQDKTPSLVSHDEGDIVDYDVNTDWLQDYLRTWALKFNIIYAQICFHY